jgi:hypothetical protein
MLTVKMDLGCKGFCRSSFHVVANNKLLLKNLHFKSKFIPRLLNLIGVQYETQHEKSATRNCSR